MAPGNVTRRPETNNVYEESVSDSESQSGSPTGESSNFESDSDSLDSTASRKRRKVSPRQPDDSETEDRPLPSRTPVLSRVKARTIKDNAVEIPTLGNAISVPTDSETSFESLNVKKWLVGSLNAMAIKRPTGIQKGCIPEILNGRDCIGGSRTGSGKTVAFAVPILQKWAEDPIGIYALVLTPTRYLVMVASLKNSILTILLYRELALQIYEQFKAISSPQSLKAILVTGGSDMRTQATALAQRPHIVISTPGRLADHIRTSGEDTICGLRRVRMVVLDEADRLLASGNDGSMLPDVEECLSVLPPAAKRQTLLFTATVTPEVRALKELPRTPGKPPVFVCEIDTQNLAIPPTLKQTHVQMPVTHREHYLHSFLLTDVNLPKSVIIFCNRTSTADYVTHLLRLLEHRVTALHSKLPQRQRIDNLARFRAAAARILVATDVAARGLDIPEVGLVINYDIPRDPDDYIHRVGRTARAGRKGEATTFVGQRDVELILAIEARVGRQLEPWTEEGVNLETRVIRSEALKLVSTKKREALLEIEENKEVGGKRKRGMQKLRAK